MPFETLSMNHSTIHPVRCVTRCPYEPFNDGILRGFTQRGNGGEGGIRTHGTIAGTRAFQARRIGHSRTSPLCSRSEKAF